MNVGTIKRLLGLSRRTKLTSPEEGLALTKQKIIEARRSNNDALAAELSQVKEFFKRKRSRRCQVCLNIINSSSTYCSLHYQAKRYYSKQLISPVSDISVSD